MAEQGAPMGLQRYRHVGGTAARESPYKQAAENHSTGSVVQSGHGGRPKGYSADELERDGRPSSATLLAYRKQDWEVRDDTDDEQVTGGAWVALGAAGVGHRFWRRLRDVRASFIATSFL